MKKDLEDERAKLKIQLKRKQARNRRNRLARPHNIVVSVNPSTSSGEGTSSGQQFTFSVSVIGKTSAAAVNL